MLTRSMIEQMAVNDSSFKNGEKLYDKGSFYELKRTEDSKVYWALCEGSGKNPYKVSVDMSDESKLPVCRCSCPSRQFPCKHGIGLMLSIAAGKDFCVDEIPSEIKEKHEKAEEREAKKIAKQAKPKKVTAASIKASEKKIEKQLEGLDLCRKMMNELMTSGLATLSGTSLEKFRELSAELYNYGLPGPQRIINRIAESVANFRDSEKNEDKSKEFYAGTLKHLIHLNTVVKKGRAFLEKKLADKDFAESDDILFEELGGIWKLESLDKIGSFQENARLIELSFDETEDNIKEEIQQKSYCMNLDTKEICVKLNMVPVKIRSKVRLAESCFDMIRVPVLYKYPGTDRVRYDNFTTSKIEGSDLNELVMCAEENFEVAEKKFKNYIKNTLHEKELMVLLPAAEVLQTDDSVFMKDAQGNMLELVMDTEHVTDINTLRYLPAAFANMKALYYPPDFDEVKAIFGKMFFNESKKGIQFQLYSVVTAKKIIRIV